MESKMKLKKTNLWDEKNSVRCIQNFDENRRYPSKQDETKLDFLSFFAPSAPPAPSTVVHVVASAAVDGNGEMKIELKLMTVMEIT